MIPCWVKWRGRVSTQRTIHLTWPNLVTAGALAEYSPARATDPRMGSPRHRRPRRALGCHRVDSARRPRLAPHGSTRDVAPTEPASAAVAATDCPTHRIDGPSSAMTWVRAWVSARRTPSRQAQTEVVEWTFHLRIGHETCEATNHHGPACVRRGRHRTGQRLPFIVRLLDRRPMCCGPTPISRAPTQAVTTDPEEPG